MRGYSKLIWMARWHVARAAIHAALWLAPRGAARDRLMAYIEAFGDEVATAIANKRQKQQAH